MMEVHDSDYNLPLPEQSTLSQARARAHTIADQRLTNAYIDDQTYQGIDLAIVPKSLELCTTATLNSTHGTTFFDDFLVAEFYRNARRKPKTVVDSTIPRDIVAIKAHVDLLVKAFKSTTGCDDNQQMIRPFEDRRHDSKLVECLCWSIVKACIYRCKSDEPLLVAYEPLKARNSHGIDTFAKRFDAIVIAMAKSKTICKHLYDAPYLNTFVDDPVRAIRRVDANRDLNKQKAGIMSVGKQILKKEDDGDIILPQAKSRTPRKRTAAEAGIDLREHRSTPRSEAYNSDLEYASSPLTIHNASRPIYEPLDPFPDYPNTPTQAQPGRSSRQYGEVPQSLPATPRSAPVQMTRSYTNSSLDNIKNEETSPTGHFSVASTPGMRYNVPTAVNYSPHALSSINSMNGMNGIHYDPLMYNLPTLGTKRLYKINQNFHQAPPSSPASGSAMMSPEEVIQSSPVSRSIASRYHC